MIGRKPPKPTHDIEDASPKGFDDFELRLGDVMRGERATLGKSLLDVQRELRIKASYIAAIENCDPSAFDTPGFIAGYVRSYARYLGMDPDDTYAVFCAESGFETAHGMSDAASSRKKVDVTGSAGPVAARDPFVQPNLPFAPSSDSILSRIEPGAIGSTLVLVLLLGGLGYGGYSVLQEVQRVQLAPVDQTPVVLSDLDPLQSPLQPTETDESTIDVASTGAGVFTPPATVEAFDRLYRPQALDVPVLVARDAPISTLDPNSVGAFASVTRQSLPAIDLDPPALADVNPSLIPTVPQQGVTLIAARPAWVRVRAEDRSILFERVMASGETWTVPASEAGALLNVGESGALYVAVNGQTVGPIGPTGTVTSDLPLDGPTLSAALEPADLQADTDLSRVMASLSAPADDQPVIGQPKILEDSAPGVTLVAVRPAWIRVRAADGSVIYETIMNAGDTYQVPATEEPPTLRVGESGAIYFAMNGQTYGPAGPRGSVTSNVALSVDSLSQTYSVASVEQDSDLARVVAELAVATTAEE